MQQALEFNSSLTAFDNDQWRKGGMTCSGLRETTQARNYFYGPGRQNLIPNADSKSSISSIGIVQTNGLGSIASGSYGPGTLLSANFSVKYPSAANDVQMGVMQSRPNKITFVDYRQTDPLLVNNLRINPLSIYAQGNNVENNKIPEFFADVRPDNYSSYIHEENIDIDNETKELYVDGSPNVSILGLAQQNPFMGLGRIIPNDKPKFLGKVYGGDSNAKHIAENLYNSVWSKDKCQNKALSSFSQGYNVAPQINEGKYIKEGPHANSNLPWGPIKVTNNPKTQQGGIWQKGQNEWPTKYDKLGVQTNDMYNNLIVPQKFINPYKNGLPGTLY